MTDIHVRSRSKVISSKVRVQTDEYTDGEKRLKYLQC